jgi:subtilisin family serine protease
MTFRALLRAPAVFLFLSFLFGIELHAADRPAFQPGRILIIPKADKAAALADLHRKKGRSLAKHFAAFKNLQVVDLAPGQDVLATIDEYMASGLVETAEPDYLLYKDVTPNDPAYLTNALWQLNSTNLLHGDINAPLGWEIRHDATNIVVAIVDTGMRMTHEDLAPNLWTNSKEIPGNGIDDDGDGYIDDVHGISSIDGSGNPTDTDGHGTHVAGIIGAIGNNGLGVTGVAWKVQLMPLRFIGANDTGLTSDGVECINYAIQHGANVINASFGAPTFSAALQTAIATARAAGIVVVAAAGNEKADNDITPSYPANFTLDNIISVCATSDQDVFDASYSNFGATSVDIGAPGTRILSCGIASDSAYALMSGTSMATPIISGVVALAKAQFPDETPAQIRQRLIATADPLPSLFGKCVSGGKVNLQRALSPYVIAAFSPSAIAGAFPLTIQFTNQSVGISSSRWEFGDGSTASTDTNPTHTFYFEGAFNVTLTVVGTNGATASITKQISVEPSYTFQSVNYEWIDPTSMPRFTLADNGVSGAQDLPFAFTFYGQPRTQIYIGANGLLGFDPANMGAIGNSDIPSVAAPNGAIMPYWDNLNPANTGAVYAGVVGDAPNRRYVVSWVGVIRNTSSDKMTFQAALSESTGAIQFNYLEVNPMSLRGGGLRATVGVEDFAGIAASKFCFDGAPNMVTNQESIVFTPSSRKPIRFDAPSYAKGVLDINVNGAAGWPFTIEASNDLATWTPVLSGVVDASGIIHYSDDAAASGNRFFRANVLPQP